MEVELLIPVVVGVVEAVKRAFKMPSKYCPLLSIAIGVGLSYFMVFDSLSAALFRGLVVGLSAVGLYSGARATLNGLKSSNAEPK